MNFFKINILFLCCNFVVLHAMDKPIIQVVPPLIKSFQIPGNIQSGMFYTPDGKHLLANVHISPTKNVLQLIKTDYYTQVTDIPMSSAPSYIVDVSPDSEYVVTADDMGPLHRWNINDEHVEPIPYTQQAGNAAFDMNAKRLMVSTPDGVYVLDLASETIIHKLVNSETCSANFAWNVCNTNEAALCYLGDDWKNTKWGIWDLVADKIRPLATVTPQLTGSFTYSNDGKSLVAGALNQYVQCDIKTAALAYYALNGAKSTMPFPTANGKSLYSSQLLPGNGMKFFAGTDNNEVAYCDTDDTSQSFIFNPESSDTTDPVLAIALNLSQFCKQLAVPTQNDQNQYLLKIYDLSRQTRLADERKQVKEQQLKVLTAEKPKSTWFTNCTQQ